MWCLETIIAINQEAARLAAAGLPEADALENVGISRVQTDHCREQVPAAAEDRAPVG